MENKQLLRQKMRQKIKNQTIDDRDNSSKIIFNQLINSEVIHQSQTISIYWATNSEVATKPIIEYLLAQNKKVCLPMINESNKMVMYAINSLETIAKIKPFFVLQTQGKSICLPSEIDCIIVPGVAFDSQNNRLGQGQGHYDQYLKKTQGLTIMLAFEIQKVNNILVDEWDVPIAKIYTEKFIYNKCNNKM